MTTERHPTEEVLSAFLDGELAAGERAAIAAHLEACEACRGVLAAYERVDRDAAAPALGDAGARSEREWEALAIRIDRAIDAEAGAGAAAARAGGALEAAARAARGAAESRPSAAAPSSRRAAREAFGNALMRAFARPSVAWGAAGTFAAVLLVLVLRPETERLARTSGSELDTTVGSPAPQSTEIEAPAEVTPPVTPEKDARVVRPGAGLLARGGLAKSTPPREAEGGEAAAGEAVRDEAARARGLRDEAAGAPAPREEAPKIAAQAPVPFAEAPSPPAFLDPPAVPRPIAGVASPEPAARTRLAARLADSLAAFDAEAAERRARRTAGGQETSLDAVERAESPAGAGSSIRADAGAPPAGGADPPRLAREIDLVSRLFALDPEGRCDDVRARMTRWHADPAWDALEEEPLRRAGELERACPD